MHFRLQYLVLGIGLAGAALLRRRGMWLIAAVVVVALNVAPVRAQLQSAPAPLAFTSQGAAIPVRIAAANVLQRNSHYAAAVRWARVCDADVLVFTEVDAPWQAALRALSDTHPYELLHEPPGRTPTLVRSRWPLAAGPVLAAGAQVVDVLGPAAAWRLLAVHASWPLGPGVSRARARDFEAIAAAARASPLPVVAIGDFNVSPFSPHFAALLASGGLRDAAGGGGWQPTWPTFLPPAGIRIDHALVSPDIRVNSFRRGRLEGSDHRPIVVELALPARRSLSAGGLPQE